MKTSPLAAPRVSTLGVASLLFAVLLVVGCNAGPEYEVASGKVALPDRVLSIGLITLVPIDGNKGKKVSGSIKEGAFEFNSKAGLVPGKYRVEIFAVSPGIQAIGKGSNPHTVEGEVDFREIRPEFNVASTLTATIKEGDENVMSFEVLEVD